MQTSMTEVDHPLGPKGLFSTSVTDISKAIEKLGRDNHYRLKSELNELNQEQLWELLDELTRRVVDDRPLYLRNKTSKTNVAKSRLRLRSKALRLVVSYSISRISDARISNLINHIDQTLRSSSEGIILPLLPEYPRTLGAILASGIQVERLSQEDRNIALDLCVEFLPVVVEKLAPGSTHTNGHSFIRSTSESIQKSSGAATPRALDEEARLEFKETANAFLGCLGSLVGASNAPILDNDKAEQVLSAAIKSIETRTLETKAGFQLINSLLKRSTLNCGEFTRMAIQRLIPLLKSYWSKELRDELLIMLIYTDAYISAMLQSEEDDAFKLDLSSLLEVIQADYKSSKIRSLPDDHLCFRHAGRPPGILLPVGTLAFSLHSEHDHMKSETCTSWMVVYFISHYASILDSRKRLSIHKRDNDDESIAKRPRVESNLRGYLREASDRRLQKAARGDDTRTAALQVISFMVQEGPLDDEDLFQILETLHPLITNDTPSVSAWALIGLTATAFQKSSKSSKFTSQWESIWQTASRTITSESSSRAACHLMNVVLILGLISYDSISEIVERITSSVELNGPELLTESSSSLWTTVLRGRTEGNPALFNETSERILQWLFSKWTPNQFSERSYSEHNSLHCNSRDVLRLIAACLDRPPLPASGSSFAVLKSIGTAWLHAQAYRKLTDYLLLSHDSLPFQSELEVELFNPEFSTSQPTNHLLMLETRVFEFLTTELEKTQQKWKEWISESPQNITQNMLRIVLNLGFASSAFCFARSPSQTRRVQKLETMLEDFFHSFNTLFSRRIDDQYKLDTVLDVFAQAAPDISQLISLDPKIFRESGVLTFAPHMSKALETQRLSMESFYTEDNEFMDIDNGPDSQMTDENLTRDRHVSRHDLVASTSLESLRSSSSAYLNLVACIVGSTVDEDSYNTVPSGFVDYLKSISAADFLHCRQFVTALISGPGQLQKSDCQALFDHIGAEVIRQFEYQTSEVAEGLVLELLIGTESLWIDGGSNDRETQDLYATGQDFYEWYLGGYDSHGWSMSTNLQIGVSNLCLCLQRSQPDFAQNLSLPSVRTSLFCFLSDSDIPVQYHIANCLPDMFSNFILATHDTIFDDIHDSLPNQQTVEDIAVRLLVLSRLGSSWHTLLRRCVYLIFETAGLIDYAMPHAERCISNLSSSIKLENSKALFRIFAPQIIYSWLHAGNKFADIPFPAFKYNTLLDLLEDVEDEAFGQAMMVGKEDELQYLANLSEQSLQDALERNFAKAASYCISWDTCKGNGMNKTIKSNEARLQAILGKELYTRLFHWNFPRILGITIYTMDNENLLDKRLAKRPMFANTTTALTEIKTTSHSSQTLPEGIAPAFTAKYLPDQIERLCRRLHKDPVGFWTPEIFVFAMRMLLDRIHPALGSLHACSIIRKIRVLVSLAGTIALDGYPLQMTLQSLRPFLTDSQCAEDTLGIMQYLFERGRSFLSSQLSFVTGIGLSILISIRVFLGSTQESTTQESQYHATLERARSFHSWFTGYLETYPKSVQATRSHLKAFTSIVRAASQTRIEGNANIGTAESKLLLEILDDERSKRTLLSGPSREIAFNLLCQNFQPPKSMHDDILGSDEEAVRFAPQIWKSCQRSGVGEGYLTWAARALGRAFSAHGELERDLRTASIERNGSYALNKDGLRSSRAAIFHSLSDLLLSDDRKEMGLAETTIRLTLTKSKSDVEKLELDPILPEYIATALKLQVPEAYSTHRKDPTPTITSMANPTPRKAVSLWIRDLTITLCETASQDALLGSLSHILQGIEGYAEKLFPFVLHLVLHKEFGGKRNVREAISPACVSWFVDCCPATVPYVKILIRAILYLRTQAVPHEITREDRDSWLKIDYIKAAEAATACGMYKSALLFAETHSAPPLRGSRRSSTMPQMSLSTELQFAIYKNLDEPDSFYGVEREPNLPSILDRLDYEASGVKSLLFRGALMDSQMRQTNTVNHADSRGMIKSLIILNLNSVTHTLLSNEQFHNTGQEVVNSTLHTARKLEQWDIRASQTNNSEASSIFKAFQGIHYSSDSASARAVLESQVLATMGQFVGHGNSSEAIKGFLRTLAVLSEIDDIVTVSDRDQLADAWKQMQSRVDWMQNGQFDDVKLILSCRETLFSVLSRNLQLQNSLRVMPRDIRQKEIASLLSSSATSRKHGAWQESLASATYLSSIINSCASVGLNIEALAENEVANVLWEQGESATSIRIRQKLLKRTDLYDQSDTLSVSILLVKLGHHVAEARLEKPDEIMKEYLIPAIQKLQGQSQGAEPGQVFHEFASFCDKQLHDPDAIEDVARMKTGMERKGQEAEEYEKLARISKSGRDKDRYKKDARSSRKWQELDGIEYEKLRQSREDFLRQCLENYLLSLQACDKYDTDVLRVFSLWLEYSETPLANEAVGAQLSKVPSGKFAVLMNQLSSRLQAEKTKFQALLTELVFRLCTDHPYHGMHQIYAGAMPSPNKDDATKLRVSAAKYIASMLKKDSRAGVYWVPLEESNGYYHELAIAKAEDDRKTGRDQYMDKHPQGRKLLQKIPVLKVPPATISLEIRASCDYSDVPKITGFRPRIAIANGLSAPKIITAIASDGKPYKQLFKSGNDDLRQDAIMEQVFEQTSGVLKNHPATRTRNLHIRTYKVVPLSPRSGLMEFVPNTIALHNYLIPAHELYYPKDLKSDQCRKLILNVSTESNSVRLRKYREITERFNPVMRYFFLERFEDPDEWFEKRLAYTRSTAAISILGHVLGLGDRHCHNILLDEQSGEVVHIDLGIAFEAGRVLPVPEVVPFRLTRDLVDGMGYTKTEGVFRRCCEFTLEALREEREGIMTLLNVLRYDPLVNWSLSVSKAKRLQDGQGEGRDTTRESRTSTVPPAADELADQSSKRKEDDTGEAARALSVVEKKLSKTLSTAATVNELITQATDERNLAILFCGWAAYV